ncbi:MAG: 2Fe-2S iron-sulfur cluster binding domain-containing protein [Streptosporangiales bacterium]|nr:2Fe-2S iron-sulfur cluster binding domain-containing protein [Streptosporangiales bacterium]
MSEMRTVRAAADELVPVRFTVNGTEVATEVPARLTLADVLRDRLGLTGTHLGCEHGVCGMCTVLVDGEAARSCLLFACQLDGSELVTVEGLGRPDDMHPLQESFSKHHALQCGFCTPGFLMSAYDLLDHDPEVTREQLPTELSGVLCRCTGYRNIVDAVDDVASAHRDGVPAPRNCRPTALAGRQALAVSTPAESGGGEPPPAVGRPDRITLPDSEPTVVSTVSSVVAVAPQRLWPVLDDTALLARCLPGAELTEDLGDGWYRGRAKVALGPVRLAFNGVAQVVERDAAARQLRVLGQGEDAGGGRVQADIRLTAADHDGGAELTAHANVYLAGRIAQFGRSLADDVSRQLFEQFAASVATAATGGEVATVKPPGALRLLGRSLSARIRALFGRRRRRR